MSDCCLIKKVATVEVYENKNEVRAYSFMAGDKNTPMMEVKFRHLWGEENLSKCKLRWIIVDDLGSLLVGEVPIEQDNTASIQLPNELFNGERRMKVQLTVASCDGNRILNLQQFTDLKVINSLAANEVVEPVYDILINKLYDGDLTFVLDNFNTLKAEYQKNNALLGEALNGMVSNSRLTNNSITSDKLRIAEDSNKIKLVNLSDEVISAMSGNSPVRPEIGAGEVVTEKIADEAVNLSKLSRNIQQLLDTPIFPYNLEDEDFNRTSWANTMYTPDKEVDISEKFTLEFNLRAPSVCCLFILKKISSQTFEVLEKFEFTGVLGINSIQLENEQRYSNVYLGFLSKTPGLMYSKGSEKYPEMNGNFYEAEISEEANEVINTTYKTGLNFDFAFNGFGGFGIGALENKIFGIENRTIVLEGAKVVSQRSFNYVADVIGQTSRIHFITSDMLKNNFSGTVKISGKVSFDGSDFSVGSEVFLNNTPSISDVANSYVATKLNIINCNKGETGYFEAEFDVPANEYLYIKPSVFISPIGERTGRISISDFKVTTDSELNSILVEKGIYKNTLVSTLYKNTVRTIATVDEENIERIASDTVDKALENSNHEIVYVLSKVPLLKYKKDTNLDNTFFEQAYFLGRWFKKEVDGVPSMITINQGSELYFKVKGATQITLNFRDLSTYKPYINYQIDDAERVRTLIADKLQITLPSAGEHYIRIISDGIKETDDLWVGEKGLCLQGITVDAGTVEPYKPTNRKIQFYGDSITAGINVLGVGSVPAVNSGTNTYAYYCCKNLNAVSIRAGFGATGMTRGGSGGVPKCLEYIDNMTKDRETISDFPDLIVINHGTNDSGATHETFVGEYKKVIDRLKIKFPGIPIFCMTPFNQRHNAGVLEITTNNDNVYHIPTSGWGVTFSDGLHPDLNGGVIAGEKLAESILKIVGKNFFIN